MSSVNREEIRYVQVWSGWLRLAHWVIAGGVLFQLASAWAITEAAMDIAFWRDWHLMVGQVVLMAVLLRIVLLFVPGTSHWRSLIPERSQSEAFIQMIKFYLSFGRAPLPNWYAHNPFWKPFYLIVILALAGACVTGWLQSAEAVLWEGAEYWHGRLGELIAVFTLFHVVAVFLHDLKGKGAYLSAMISGSRYFHVSSNIEGLRGVGERPTSVNIPLDSISRPGGDKRG